VQGSSSRQAIIQVVLDSPMVQRSRSFGCAKKPCRNTLQFAWLASGWCVAGVSCSLELGTKKIRRRGRLRSTIIQGFRFTAESSHTICSNLKCPIFKLTVADSVYFWRNEVAPNSNSSASRNLRISSKLILLPHCLQHGKISPALSEASCMSRCES
jgi:hypothetical protein